MIEVGWFGKIPSSKEYVSEQISGKLPLWLRNWVESGHEEFLSLFPERRGNIFKNLRFIILDQQNNTCLVGILTRSTDSIGRQFPATFFAQVPINIFSDLTYLPVITGPIWRLLENTPPEEMEVVREQIEDWQEQGQLGILPRNKTYIDNLVESLTVGDFARFCGISCFENFNSLLNLKFSGKNRNDVPPLCIRGKLPGEKTLFFLCLWYLIIKKVFVSGYLPHCFLSGSEADATEFTLFFRWPLKRDFLLLQGIDIENGYNIDLTKQLNNVHIQNNAVSTTNLSAPFRALLDSL